MDLTHLPHCLNCRFSDSTSHRLKDEADEVLFIDEMWDTLKYHKGKPSPFTTQLGYTQPSEPHNLYAGAATQGCRYVGCPCKPISAEPGTSRPLCAYHTCPGCAGIKRSTADMCFTCSPDINPEIGKCATHDCTEQPADGARFCNEHSCFRCGRVKGREWPTCKRCANK